MAGLRAGSVVSRMVIYLVSVMFMFPVTSVLGGGTTSSRAILHEEEVTGGDLWSRRSGLGSPSHIEYHGLMISGRKMLAAGRPVEAPTSTSMSEQQQQLDRHASTVETQPTPGPARFATRFAFLFRSLAKGSSPPSTGTPSPGHN